MSCQQNPCAGCGKNACCSACGQAREIRIRRKDADFLLRFAELPFLPAVRFSLRRLNGSSSESDCLAPVFLSAPSETFPDVCQTAGILTRLLEQKLISVSYTEPLERFNYSNYVNSAAFTDFCARATGFAIPEIEYGSMALTALGQEVIDDLELYVLPRSDKL